MGLLSADEKHNISSIKQAPAGWEGQQLSPEPFVDVDVVHTPASPSSSHQSINLVTQSGALCDGCHGIFSLKLHSVCAVYMDILYNTMLCVLHSLVAPIQWYQLANSSYL